MTTDSGAPIAASQRPSREAPKRPDQRRRALQPSALMAGRGSWIENLLVAGQSPRPVPVRMTVKRIGRVWTPNGSATGIDELPESPFLHSLSRRTGLAQTEQAELISLGKRIGPRQSIHIAIQQRLD